MGIREDFLKFRNAAGFCSNSPGGSSGNDLLFSAEARAVMAANNAWDEELDQKPLIRSIVMSAEIEPGLYKRPGWIQDQEAQDDYVGLALVSSAIAGCISSYGYRHWWYFKSTPAAKWWEPIFWRWPALIAHVSWCWSQRPWPWFRLAWAIAIATGPTADDLDSFKLAWLMILGCRQRGGWLETWATDRFRAKLAAAYPSGMKQVYASYFGATHPIAVWCPEYWK